MRGAATIGVYAVTAIGLNIVVGLAGLLDLGYVAFLGIGAFVAAHPAVTAPIIAFVLFNGNLGLWHLPMFYDAALRGEWVHHFQHILFAGFAMIYWWTIIDPVPRHHRLLEVWAMGSVFLSMMISSIIGAIITLSNSVLYSFYLEAANPWGWSPLVDQQVGGLIMWVGSFFLYLIVVFALLAKLLQRDELNAELEVQRARAREQAATTS
jgi:cytochrome c oxidase assembly factor CtaG